MKLISLSLSGYRQFLELPPLTIPEGLIGVCGRNGVGKSKLVEAIGYAFFGPHDSVLPRGDVADDISSKARVGADPTVDLVIELRGQLYEIHRSRRQAYIRLQGSEDNLADTRQGVTRKVIELLRLTPGAYAGTFVARQNDIAGLQSLEDTRRKQLVNRLIGIEQVEKAIALAHEATREAKGTLQVEQRLLTIPSAQARQDAERAKEALAKAADAEVSAKREASAAHTRYEVEQGAYETLCRQAAQVQSLQEQLKGWQAHAASLTTAIANARKRDEAGKGALADLAQQKQFLRRTATVPEELSRYDTLATIAELRAEQAEAKAELERLRPHEAQRQVHTQALARYRGELRPLQSKLASCSQLRARAEERLEQANVAIASCDEERGELIEMGAAGVCPKCGRTFGDDLEEALVHQVEELGAAYRTMAQATFELVEAQAREQEAQGRVNQNDFLRAYHEGQLQQYQNVPGEISRLEQEIQNDEAKVVRLFATLPDSTGTGNVTSATDAKGSLRNSPLLYDPNKHAELREVAERRSQVMAEVQRLQALVQASAGAKEEALSAELDLAEADRQIGEITSQVEKLTLTAGELEAQQGAAEAAKAEYDRCVAELLRCTGAVAAAQAQAETSNETFEKAMAQEHLIAVAARAVVVAERTEQLMRRLLTDINATARPAIADYMDTWARSLMGPHFRQVELTADYKIQADNGSGLHDIEHFSGGEQTLLAIMLRVAISRYCQEHALLEGGFLILDEVFGNQDSEHRNLLVQFLGQIQEHYSQILVINHIEDVTELLDSVIDVTETGPVTSIASLRA